MPTIEHWTPIRELDRMERRMRRLFEDAGFFPHGPATDIYETEDEFVLELDVPGFDERELDIEVFDHSIVVKGVREEIQETQGRTPLVRERLEREFVRTFELPVIGDTEHVSAAFAKGVLTLHVPKTEEARPKKVAIGPS